MSDPSKGSTEPIRIPDNDLDDLASTLAGLVGQVRRQGVILDNLRDAATEQTGDHPAPSEQPSASQPTEAPHGTSVFILALGGESYDTELRALSGWVNHLLLPAYGREISTTRPWCARWHEHLEAVARLHALWLAWQQLTDAEAGPSGPSTWHRDHLDPAWLQLRAPDGPFAACTTSPTRPNHRLLTSPAPEQNGAAQ